MNRHPFHRVLWLTAVVILATALPTSWICADLVLHIDPNDTRTTFQGGWEDNRDGTLAATELGDPVGWVMDTRVPSAPTPDPDNGLDGWIDAQQGNGDNKPAIASHPAGNVLDYLDSGNNDTLLIFENDTALADGFLGAADTNLGSLIVASRIDSAGTGNSYLIDFRDDAAIGGGSNAIDGFGLRYNHTTSELEGIVKQSVVASVPVTAGEWFVTSLVWDGPNTTATLSVETLAGVFSDSGAASDVALDVDRARLGNTSNGSDGMLGQLGDVMYFNDVDDHTADFTALADAYVIPLPGLTIDRDTGSIAIAVPAGAPSLTNVVGYTMTSASGALDPNQWTSIADNYDAGSPGPSQVDPDNQWTKLTNPALRGDLSELEFEQNGGFSNGAEFVSGSSTDLGAAWIQYDLEDVVMNLVMDDNSVVPLAVSFTGNGGTGFQFGDLDFDGDIDADDFHGVLAPHYGDDTSVLASRPERYQAGDLDENGVIDLVDFNLLNAAYLAANPLAAPLSFAVPEPSGLALLTLGGVAILCRRRRSAQPGSRCDNSANTTLRHPFPRSMKMRHPCSKSLWTVALAVACCLTLAPWASAVTVLDVDFGHLSTDPDGLTVDGQRAQDTSGNRYHGFYGGGSGGLIGMTLDGSRTVLDTSNNNVYVILRDDLADGGDGSPNPWWGSGNTPTPYFTLDAAKDYTFEAVLQWDPTSPDATHGIMGQTGGTEWWIREGNGDLEYVFDDGPNRVLDVDRIDVSGLINNSDWHHLAIVLDRGTDEIRTYFDYQLIDTNTDPVIADFGEIGLGTGDIRLGGYNTSASSRFDGVQDHYRVSDVALGVNDFLTLPADPEWTLEVNTDTGAIAFVNETGVDLDIDSYRITSSGNSLNPSGWSSLDDQDYDGAGSWTALGDASSELSEGFFGGHSVIGSPSRILFGNAFDTTLNVQDVAMEVHVTGDAATSFFEIMVEYVEGGVPVPGDYNNSGLVEQGDLDLVLLNWGDDWPPAVDGWVNDQPTDGKIDQNDLDGVLLNWGNALASAQAVPEPSAGVLSLMLLGIVGFCLRRGRGRRAVVGVVILLSASTVFAASNDRDYTLGDDGAEGAAANAVVTGQTFDSAGTPGAGDLQDLNVDGAPLYRAVDGVGGRPGAAAGDLGIEFDGVADRLITTISLNLPSDMWDNTTFFPLDNFPHNYEGISSHGIQLWAQPDPAALAAGNRQDLVIDTPENGVFIASSGTWGLQFDGGGDSGVSVASTLNDDGWAHVMQVGGLVDPVKGRSRFQGALYVNGVAVIASAPNQTLDSNATELSIASNQAGDSNFYAGTLDDVRLFFWGDNSQAVSGDGRLGQDWGPLNLGVDNDWIAQELASLNVTELADVNLDGVVSGDGTGLADVDDVSALVSFWQSRNEVGGILVGDWASRQEGDLNYDGSTDIFDAIILRDALISGGLGSFDFDLLSGVTVPEPSSALLALWAGMGLLCRRSSGRR